MKTSLTLTKAAFVLAIIVALGAGPARAEQFKPVAAPKSPIVKKSARFEETPKVDLDQGHFDVVAVTNRIDPAWLKPPTEKYRLGAGDRLDLEIIGDAASRTSAVVGPDGKIYFGLLPGLNVRGKTLDETRVAIVDAMKQYLRSEPDVAITLRGAGSKTVWVLGNVQLPGVQPITGPMTVLDALTLAGGTLSVPGSTDGIMDLKRSFLMRRGNLIPLDFEKLLREGDFSQNIYLQPNDLIYLRSAAQQNVYVLGAVLSPNMVPFAGQVTLLEAIAACGGLQEYAHSTRVVVVRGSLVNPQVAEVNFRDIRHGKAKDLKLEAGDIVYVPYVVWRKAAILLDVLVREFTFTVAANEGFRATVPNAAPISPTIPFFNAPITTGVNIPVSSGVNAVVTPTR